MLAYTLVCDQSNRSVGGVVQQTASLLDPHPEVMSWILSLKLILFQINMKIYKQNNTQLMQDTVFNEMTSPVI